MESISEFASRVETTSIFELRRDRAEQARIIRSAERAGELVDFDEWRVLDILDAELAERFCPAA